MHRILLAPLAATLLAGGCGISIDFDGPAVRGSGVAASESRTLPAFERVAVSGDVDVAVSVGGSPRATVAGDDNLVPLVKTEVRGNTLHVEPARRLRPVAGLRVSVSTPTLEGAAVGGSGSLRATGVRSDAFRASISGSGEMVAEGDFGDLSTGVSGSGELTMRGSAETVRASVSGSGEIDLIDVPARTARVTVSGSGDVAVHARERIVVRVSGSGDVRYRGDAIVDSRVTGSGRVERVPEPARARASGRAVRGT